MGITAIIVFIAILSLLVFIHELGHYVMARIIGVRVEEFGFGLPPRIWGKKVGKTIYSLNWLPIGGFVRLAGEDSNEVIKGLDKNEYFFARSKLERSAILLAGVTMNFFLAVCITTFLLTQGVAEVSGRVHIEQVAPGGPAASAGFQKNDIVEGYTVPKDLIAYINDHKGKEITLTIVRDGIRKTVVVTPRSVVPKGEGPLGIAVSDLETHVYPLREAPWIALKTTITRAWEMITGVGTLLRRLIMLQPVGGDVAGPIGIASVTGQAVKFGWKAVLEFMSILSLNLAVLNILPIPALDGGRFAFVVLEAILGKRVKSTFEQSTHQIGMIALFILIILISINDILKLARGG